MAVVLMGVTFHVACQAGGNARTLPAGFHASQTAGTTGTILSGRFPGATGRAVLMPALNRLQGWFDQAPRIVQAMETQDRSEIQVLFTAPVAGQAIRGFARGTTAGGGAVTIFYDRAERFAQSLPSAAMAGGQRSGGAVPLHRVQLPGGVGWLSMPDGWRITSTRNNVVMAEGPHGAIDFGVAIQVYTREFAAQSPFPPPVVADYGDAARAVSEVTAKSGLIRNMRVLERAPSPGWDGIAEYIHFQADYQGVPSEILALVLEKPIGPGTWFFYYSQVRTRAGQFARNLPVLLEIWKSWKTDDRVFQQRLNQAMESMQTCNRIIREVNANRQDAMDRSVTAWSHYIRGTWPVEDTRTGTRYAAPADVAGAVRTLNEAEGYQRWRAIPYQELNR